MAHRLTTPAGRALYALRKQMPEPVFGIIKSALAFRQFSLRGLAARAANGASSPWSGTSSGCSPSSRPDKAVARRRSTDCRPLNADIRPRNPFDDNPPTSGRPSKRQKSFSAINRKPESDRLLAPARFQLTETQDDVAVALAGLEVYARAHAALAQALEWYP